MDVAKPYELVGVGDIHGPQTLRIIASPPPGPSLRTPKIGPTCASRELFPAPPGAQNRPLTHYVQDSSHGMLRAHGNGRSFEDSQHLVMQVVTATSDE